MGFLRTGFFSAVATGAKLISGFLILKIIAMYAGPEGIAQFGQFMSFATVIVIFGSGGVAPGVVKYLAEYKGQKIKIGEFLNTSVSYVAFFSFSTCIFVLFFKIELANFLFGEKLYIDLIILLAFIQILAAGNSFLIAIKNGMMDIRRIAFIQVIGALLGLILTATLTYSFKLFGALLGYILGQGLVFFVSVYFFWITKSYPITYFKFGFNRTYLRNLSKFSLMTLVSALLGPAVQIVARSIMAENFSWEQVGYWQAITKVSESYLLFVTTAISVYYLPRLSSLNLRNELMLEICKGYRYLMPLVLIVSLSIYACKESVTSFLFTAEFAKANYLYAPQLLGDFLKVASFLLSYLMLAKAMTVLFLLTELIFSASYLLLLFIFVEWYGVIGAMYAYLVNYFLYFLVNIMISSKYLRSLA